MKYRCRKKLYFDSYDYDGNLVGENDFCIERGSVWEINGERKGIVTGNDIRLENENEWIEVSMGDFLNYFEEI